VPNWEGSTRRDRLPPNWRKLRQLVLIRDRGVCQWRTEDVVCGRPANQVDHRVRGDDHRLDNLQLLCPDHHARKSGREGAAARPPLRREPERHPGLR
jgi:5-methylcytosine-specific restriction protein A